MSADSSTADKKRIVIGHHKKVAVFFAGSACKKICYFFCETQYLFFLFDGTFIVTIIVKIDFKQFLLSKFFDIFNIGGATLLLKVAGKVPKKQGVKKSAIKQESYFIWQSINRNPPNKVEHRNLINETRRKYVKWHDKRNCK